MISKFVCLAIWANEFMRLRLCLTCVTFTVVLVIFENNKIYLLILYYFNIIKAVSNNNFDISVNYNINDVD